MVWLHGGAFVIGSASEYWYEGSRFAQQDVVLVTVNYRLGCLGFLNLSRIGGPDFAQSANLGLLDQVAALQWVRDHIARFGGDPTNVTVFGESAGGISICCLLAMPSAQGLFRRAIIQSGGPNLVRSEALSLKIAEAYLTLSGARDMDGLRRMSVSMLLATQAKLLKSNDFGGDAVFGPAVDGRSVPNWPLLEIERGVAKDVTLLIGTTKHEARLWALYDPILWWTRPSALRRWLRQVAPDRVVDILSAYRTGMPNSTGGEQTLAIMGDAIFRLPLVKLAEAQLLHRGDTRMYLFAWPSPVRGGIGSPHAIELPFVFGNLDANGVVNLTGPGKEREAVSKVAQRAWVSFALCSSPEHDDLPTWPAYDTVTRATMVFDQQCRVENDPLGRERLAWGDVPFYGQHPPLDTLPTASDFLMSVLLRPFVLIAGLILVVLIVGLLVWLTS
jgi:para-nitrobenzyl esterase